MLAYSMVGQIGVFYCLFLVLVSPDISLMLFGDTVLISGKLKLRVLDIYKISLQKQYVGDGISVRFLSLLYWSVFYVFGCYRSFFKWFLTVFGFMHISFASINNPKLIYIILFTLCDVLGMDIWMSLADGRFKYELKKVWKIILFVFFFCAPWWMAFELGWRWFPAAKVWWEK